MTKDRYTRHHPALRTTYSEDENHIENRVTISEFCVVVDLAIAKQYCACRKNTANSSPSPLTSVSKRGRWNFAPQFGWYNADPAPAPTGHRDHFLNSECGAHLFQSRGDGIRPCDTLLS